MRLIENLAGAVKPAPREIRERQRAHVAMAGPEYGKGVTQGLGLRVPAAA